MAAYSTGSDWGFPDDIPGGFQAEEQREVKQEFKREHHATAEDDPEWERIPTPPQAADASNTNPPPTQTTGSSPQQSEQQQPRERHWRPRTCRICLETVLPTFHSPSDTLPSVLQGRSRVTYESEDGGRLFRPCKCKGSQKYVHEGCLDLWRKQDPLQKRNYWQCPTCRYSYHLQRLTWARYIGSTAAQLGLTVGILVLAMFALGFVADPIINMYLDPITTISTAGGPTGSLIYEDEAVGWTEHFVKGLASIGLLGFGKFLLTLSPWHWWNMRGTGIMGGGNVGRSGVGGTGRDRVRDLSWIAIVIGILTFLWAVWKGVRAWSRRALESAGEKVMDVQGDDDNDDDDE